MAKPEIVKIEIGASYTKEFRIHFSNGDIFEMRKVYESYVYNKVPFDGWSVDTHATSCISAITNIVKAHYRNQED